jgi:biopolymer transport protein ExbB
MTFSEQVADIWSGGGFMMWPLALALAIGLVIIVWKLFDLSSKSLRTRKFLREVDELIAQRKINEALGCRVSRTRRRAGSWRPGWSVTREGSERVMKAIENVGLIEMAGLESGLVWLATVSNVAPLLGFLGTVIGMIQAFQASRRRARWRRRWWRAASRSH